MIELLTCGGCGTGFRGRSDAIYCSSACRQKAHRGRTARRVAALVEPRRLSTAGRPVFVKPDVAGAIRRARVEQRRARELRRAADETLRRTRPSQRTSGADRESREGGR